MYSRTTTTYSKRVSDKGKFRDKEKETVRKAKEKECQKEWEKKDQKVTTTRLQGSSDRETNLRREIK